MRSRPKLFRAWVWLGGLWAALVLITTYPEFLRTKDSAGYALFAFFAVYIPPIIVLILCYGSIETWERFGALNWSRLPANLRRGVLRIYVVIAMPWTLWFAYRTINNANRYREKYLSSDLLALISVPVGAIALFLIGGWLVDGFRKPSLGNAASINSKLSRETRGGQAPRRNRFSKDVEAIFEKLDFILRNERAQTEGIAEPLRSKIRNGEACDEIEGASGEFGRDVRNPIPVNGPLGELIYLSSLRTISSQQPIMFHRLGSVGAIDVFETVSLDSRKWDILFLDLYHPTKSQHSPDGYVMVDAKRRGRLLLGTNEFVPTFPKELPIAIANACERMIGLRLRPPEVREAIERVEFARPALHRATYQSMINALAQKTPSSPPGQTDFAEIGILLGKILLKPDDCWADVCKLREYEVPDAVATCEMAFARAAVIKNAVKQFEEKNIGNKIILGIDKFVEDAFSSEEETEEVLRHYQNEKLTIVAREAVNFYEKNAFPLPQLADMYAARVGVPGVPSIEIAPFFEPIFDEAERLLKLRQSTRQLSETQKEAVAASSPAELGSLLRKWRNRS